MLSTVNHVLFYAGESPTVCLVEIDSLLFRFNNSLRASSLWLWLWQRGGKRKGSLQLRLWNLNICIKKVNAKCWLAEMTLVMMSLPLAHVFQCFFCVHSRFRFMLIGRNLTAQSRRSHRGIGGGMKFQRCSCKLSFLFPPYRQSAPESLLAG